MQQAFLSIIQAGRVLYEKNLLAGFDGNISLRFGEQILITASETYKGFLSKADLVLIDYHGNVIEGSKKPSTEFRLHAKVYQERPDVQAVIHAHPPKSTAMTIAEIPFIPCLTAEAYLMLGLIPAAPYQAPGRQELADSIEPYVNQSDVILLQKHGAVTYGRDLFYCLDRLEKTEMLADKIFTLMAGSIPIENQVFNQKQRLELEAIKNNAGFKNISCSCLSDSCQMISSWKKRILDVKCS